MKRIEINPTIYIIDFQRKEIDQVFPVVARLCRVTTIIRSPAVLTKEAGSLIIVVTRETRATAESLIRFPLPSWMMPLKVTLLLLLFVSVTAPATLLVTVPPLIIRLTVSLKPFRSSVPDIVSELASGITPEAPSFSV